MKYNDAEDVYIKSNRRKYAILDKKIITLFKTQMDSNS